MKLLKPTLRTLCLEYKVTIFELEKASNVNYVLIWSVFIGMDTTTEVAQQLIQGLNGLVGTDYALDDISFKIADDRMYV